MKGRTKPQRSPHQCDIAEPTFTWHMFWNQVTGMSWPNSSKGEAVSVCGHQLVDAVDAHLALVLAAEFAAQETWRCYDPNNSALLHSDPYAALSVARCPLRHHTWTYMVPATPG